MKTIEIPDFGKLTLSHLVCDYNGTLAVDGQLLPGVSEAINAIKGIQVHVITADTFGFAEKQLKSTRCRLTICSRDSQAQWKLQYVQNLGANTTVSIGNGRNDRLMVKESAVGIALVQREGAAVETVLHADIVCTSILHALELFFNEKRIIATLRC